MNRVRGLRGATTADGNTEEALIAATKELLEKLVDANDIDAEDVAAVLFTATDDLGAFHPARVARAILGWEHVALMDLQQMKVRDSLPLCIRVLLLINTGKASHELTNVYLKGAANLRN